MTANAAAIDVPGTIRVRAPIVWTVVTVVLLAACFRWVHHWNLVNDLLVLAWIASLFLATWSTGRFVRHCTAGRRWMTVASMVFLSVPALLLVVAGAAMALGVDPVAACGGG